MELAIGVKRFRMEKKSSLIFTFLLVCIGLFGQESQSIRPADKLDRLILELQNDRWLDVPEEIELRDYSPGFSVFYMTDNPLLRENLSFAWGIGISSINVHHNGTLIPDSTNHHIELYPLPDGTSYRKNKTSATYLDLAAEFRIRTNGARRFKIMLGARGGALVNLHQKFKDDESTVKMRERKYALPYHYGLTARIMFSRIGVSGFYGLSTLFKHSESTELYPVSLGIVFSFG